MRQGERWWERKKEQSETEVEREREIQKRGNHYLEIIQGSKHWVHVNVVFDVVAVVLHRRRVDWREPEGADAQRLEVVQLLANA
jgi:hypothetical protein